MAAEPIPVKFHRNDMGQSSCSICGCLLHTVLEGAHRDWHENQFHFFESVMKIFESQLDSTRRLIEIVGRAKLRR